MSMQLNWIPSWHLIEYLLQEIIAENARLGLTKKKEKTSIKFMQKFFHRGAFYQDGDVIDEKLLHRDFNAATGFDKVCFDWAVFWLCL